MSKSIYASKMGGKLIYGYKREQACCVDNICLTDELISTFKTMLSQVRVVVDSLFQVTEAKSLFVAPMAARACIHPAIATRLLWRRAYPAATWVGSETQVLQLLDIYLQNGWPWGADPLFNNNADCLPENMFVRAKGGDNSTQTPVVV
jgi:hypothetical protein